MLDIAFLRTLSSDGVKELISLERDNVSFYNSFILPVSTGVLSITFTDQYKLLPNPVQLMLIFAGLAIILIIHLQRQISLYNIRSYSKLVK